MGLPPITSWDVDPDGSAQPGNDDGGSASEATRWTEGYQYAPENFAAARLRDVCDFTTPDVPAITAPTGVTTVPHLTGGTLAAGTYDYQVTYVNANGETVGSTKVPAVIASGTVGSVTIDFPMPTDAAARGITANVYGRVTGHIGKIASGITSGTFLDTGSVSPGAAVPVTNTTGTAGYAPNLALVQFIPFIVEVTDHCSSWGWSERDYKGRAERLLENATAEAIGTEFMHGYLATAKGYPNNFLTNGASLTDLTPGTVPSFIRGLQILQDALAQGGFGGPGMLHVQPQSAPNLLTTRRVDEGDKKRLLDLFDNVIVADPGYDGKGPTNAAPTTGESWIYATDLVTVQLDDPRIFPDTFSEALDRGQDGDPNTITFRAQRIAAASFDGARHFACKVKLET